LDGGLFVKLLELRHTGGRSLVHVLFDEFTVFWEEPAGDGMDLVHVQSLVQGP